MKRYNVHYNFYACIDIEVCAPNRERAIEKADARLERHKKVSDYDWDCNETTVTEL